MVAQTADGQSPTPAAGEHESAYTQRHEALPKAKLQRLDSASVTGSAVSAVPDPWRAPTMHPPGLMYWTDPGAQGGRKVAAFDLHGTLIEVTAGNGWQWFNEQVPAKLQQLAGQGYQLAVFSNVAGIGGAADGKKAQALKSRVGAMLDALGRLEPRLPIQVFAATVYKDPGGMYKPGRGMWDFFVQHCSRGVAPDLQQCFFCGDAAGRDTDRPPSFDNDRGFAEAVQDESVVLTFARNGETGGGGGGRAQYRLKALKRVAGIVAEWPLPITLAELPALGKQPGVGRGSLAQIKEFIAARDEA
ncbi:hypothetical protein N2152v2_010957 [Parachlorella kessleri]